MQATLILLFGLAEMMAGALATAMAPDLRKDRREFMTVKHGASGHTLKTYHEEGRKDALNRPPTAAHQTRP